MSNRLEKSDWISQGLKSLSRDGIAAVRVEPLAKKLKVTKGSFYWHFKDRNALLAAMVAFWKREATHAIIEEVERRGGSAKTRLRTLFEIVLRSEGKLELAMRAWATTDPSVARTLKTIDRKRIGYTESLFRELGFSKVEATARAHLAYHALIGQYAMGLSKPGLGPKGEFDAVFAMLTRKPHETG